MGILTETSQWENTLYQLETTDPVVGGPPNLGAGQGMSNVPHQQLANRTGFLREAIASHVAFTGASVAPGRMVWSLDGHLMVNPTAAPITIAGRNRADLEAVGMVEFFFTSTSPLNTPRAGAISNFQNFSSSSRTVLSGIMPTVFSANIVKRDGASNLRVDGLISLHNDTVGRGVWVAEVEVSGQTIRTSIVGFQGEGTGIAVCPVGATISGVPSGSHTLTVKAGRSSTASMNLVVNPSSVDIDAYGSGTQSLLSCYEVV